MQKTFLTAAITTLCAGAFAASAYATAPAQPSQGAAQPPATTAQTQQDTAVSHKELQRFAATYKDVTAIRTKYSTKLQQAKDKDDAQAIADTARGEMKTTIKKHGFTMDEYTRVVKALNSNPKLRKQFLEMNKTDNS